MSQECGVVWPVAFGLLCNCSAKGTHVLGVDGPVLILRPALPYDRGGGDRLPTATAVEDRIG